MSGPVTTTLCNGVGLALFRTSDPKFNNEHPWFDTQFNECTNKFGTTLFLFNESTMEPALKGFIASMVFQLDLTAAEIVTAYVLYESVLVANNCKCATVSCVRLLMTACISLAVKTLTDAIITTNLIAAIVQDSGFQLDEKQLGRMEASVLKCLEYRIIRSPELYYSYVNELVKVRDPMATPPTLGAM